MKKYILLLFVGVIFGCSNNDNNPPTAVMIKLSNASNYDFKNITVGNDGVSNFYGNLNAKSKSYYMVYTHAYSYAGVELQINGKTYTFQPIDYVGESYLKNGYYTYEINANASQDRYSKLSLQLVNY